MNKGTQTTLLDDIKQRPDSHALNTILERAKDGQYHDLKSQLPMPKILLHRDLILADCADLAKKVFDGDYDEIEAEGLPEPGN